jgi:multidrug efflux pump subunit AcrA (membrane-fusion protein)
MFGGELLVALGRNQKPSIYSILPGLTAPDMIRVAEMQADADGQVATARVQLDAAQIALKRAESLVAEKAGSVRAVDEARAQFESAKAALQAAQSRRELLGAPLFEAIKQDALWVRVPIYVGDIEQVDVSAAAQAGVLGARTNQASRTAKPIQVPVSAANGSATAELFYELENSDRALRPGQKVAVRVPLKGEDESLVVPASAILYDIHGGTWVYENTAPHGFTRRRVEVRYTSDGEAVLARGPAPGTKVATVAVAELFGTEFGFSK